MTTATTKRGPAVPYANAPTKEQYARWQELGGIGEAPYTKEKMERALAYMEAQAVGKSLTAEFQVPGPESDPLDRGECLVLDSDTLTRCDGRMRSSLQYVGSEGFLTIWTCTKCRRKRVV